MEVTPMLKLEIKIDDKKVEQEGKYPVASIYNAVDKAFMKYDFKKEILKDGTFCYYGNGMSKDYGIFGRIITTLKEKEWFMNYLTKWLWYNSDDAEHEADCSVEDVLYPYTKKESIA